MSVQQLEQSVRNLDPDQLARFASWFDAYRSTFGLIEEEEPELSTEQRAEIERRLDELDADPSITVPWEGTMEKVLEIREEIRAQKAARRRG